MENKLRELRRGKDLSQEELAKAVGVSRHTIIGIEKGHQEPSGPLVIKIANFLDKDPREIFFANGVVCIHQSADEQAATSA